MMPTDEELRIAPGSGEAPAIADLPIALVGRLSDDTVRLVRDEIRPAQTETTQKAKAAGLGAAMFGGAGICGLCGLGVLIAAAVVGLSLVVALSAAALIVAALFAVAAAVALMGRKERPKGGRLGRHPLNAA